MSVNRCELCDVDFDTDFDDGSYSEEGKYLCQECSAEVQDE